MLCSQRYAGKSFSTVVSRERLAKCKINHSINSWQFLKRIIFLSSSERQIILLWLEKLNSMSHANELMSIRDNYLWILLLQLQNDLLFKPFDQIPPDEGELQPITDVLVNLNLKKIIVIQIKLTRLHSNSQSK